MQISGIHHHSVIVTDMGRARAFYRDGLRLEEVWASARSPASTATAATG